MNSSKKVLMAAMVATTLAFAALGGCAVSRDQSTAGEYVDDAAITTQVKARFVESKMVDAASITVETLRGTVQLSGFAKSAEEKAAAGSIARQVKDVKSVKNDIIVRS